MQLCGVSVGGHIASEFVCNANCVVSKFFHFNGVELITHQHPALGVLWLIEMLKVATAINTGIGDARTVTVHPFIGARENVVHVGAIRHRKKFAAAHVGVVHRALATQLRVSGEGVGKYIGVERAIRALRRVCFQVVVRHCPPP